LPNEILSLFSVINDSREKKGEPQLDKLNHNKLSRVSGEIGLMEINLTVMEETAQGVCEHKSYLQLVPFQAVLAERSHLAAPPHSTCSLSSQCALHE